MLASGNPDNGSFENRVAESYVAQTLSYGVMSSVMPRQIPT